MVGGFAPGNRKLDTNITVVSLPDLPDVSAIELEGKVADLTTLPVSGFNLCFLFILFAQCVYK